MKCSWHRSSKDKDSFIFERTMTADGNSMSRIISDHGTDMVIPKYLYVIITGFNPHDDVIKRKHFPRYWTFVRGFHRSPVKFPLQSPVTRSFDVFFICAWINGWVNNREAGDLRRNRAHYDVNIMLRSRTSRMLSCSLWPLINRFIRSEGVIKCLLPHGPDSIWLNICL